MQSLFKENTGTSIRMYLYMCTLCPTAHTCSSNAGHETARQKHPVYIYKGSEAKIVRQNILAKVRNAHTCILCLSICSFDQSLGLLGRC